MEKQGGKHMLGMIFVIGISLMIMCSIGLYGCIVVGERVDQRWEELKSADKEDPANED